MNNILIVFPLLSLLLFSGCDAFDIHPYDANIKGDKGLTYKNISRIEESTKDKNQIRFAVISDTQRWYDDMEDEIKSINKQPDIDFVVHCGDITNWLCLMWCF